MASVRNSKGADVYIDRCKLGLGLFAASPIACGDLIIRLTGPAYGWDHPIHNSMKGPDLLQTGPSTITKYKAEQYVGLLERAFILYQKMHLINWSSRLVVQAKAAVSSRGWK